MTKRKFTLTSEEIFKALGCLLLPPLVFILVSMVLCFRIRFSQPRGAWLVAGLGLAPAALTVLASRRAARHALDTRWHKLAVVLFLVAFLSGAFFGDLNYWYFSQPFFLLDSLRSYTNVNPSEVEGATLMDAGTVSFTEGARLATDMGMSYTSWDVYCVAPITTDLGLPSQGANLASYDLWAVGMNCCSSGQTNFHCGEYDKASARAGLREVSAEQRPYFRLAVQQAEAAYNIQATHPIFFYWVEDPVKEKMVFFSAAFANWVLANGLHFGVNAFGIISFVVLFNSKSRDADTHLMMGLST